MARSSSPVVMTVFCVFGMAPMRKSWQRLPHPEPSSAFMKSQDQRSDPLHRHSRLVSNKRRMHSVLAWVLLLFLFVGSAANLVKGAPEPTRKGKWQITTFAGT